MIPRPKLGGGRERLPKLAEIAWPTPQVDEVDSLLGFGADVDLADAEGSTPLMKAAQAGSKPIVARLIDANADLNVLDDCNRTARDRAELVEMAAVAEVLKNHGGLLGDQVLEATSPRERERLISNAGRVKRRAGKGCDIGQLQTAPISVVFHSFRLTFGRAVISRNSLEA